MKIVFIGAGNVATHLAPAFEKSGLGSVCRVYSRSIGSAEALCRRLDNAIPVDDINAIGDDADVYVVSLVDNAVAEVLASVKRAFDARKLKKSLWMHTSGSLPMDVLSVVSDNIGVFYPLQTFSRDVAVDMAEVPVFIEGNSQPVTDKIKFMAEAITSSVHYADGDLRRRMHIAAVFACNFTNHMFTIADDLLREDGLSLEVLYPLIRETMRKAMKGAPADGQTGPAIRGDDKVMQKHMAMLPGKLAEIYAILSDSIYIRHSRDLKSVDIAEDIL